MHPRLNQPSEKILRQFAALWIPFFGLLAAWQGIYHGRPIVGWIFLGLALTLGPLGLVRPSVLRPIFVGWMWLVYPINWLVTHLILALLFFGLFTPLSLVFRLMGRDVLERRRKPDYDTYWTPKPGPPDARGYFRQS